MPSAADFFPVSLLISLFTPTAEFTTRQVSALVSQWEIFDAEPQIYPADMPPEIPRAILQSRDGGWRCEVGSRRLNLTWKALTVDPRPMVTPEILGLLVAMLRQYSDALGTPSVDRIAAVTTSVTPMDHPALFLSRHFVADHWQVAPLNRPENFELHAHKTYLMEGGFRVNSWVRNKSGFLGQTKTPVVAVEQDLNTVQGQDVAYGLDQIQDFLERSVSETASILSLYYPESR